MQQDFLLVWKMKNGDEEAMDLFVRKYYAKILQYCQYHCPDRDAAQDLTQETFVRFFAALASYRHNGRSLNYLYTIARNLCIDWGRKRREYLFLEDEGEQKSTEEAGKDEMEQFDQKLYLESALKKLPDELREAVVLHYFHELSLRETAGILQIGLPLVKYRVKRAKELLRAELEQEGSV